MTQYITPLEQAYKIIEDLFEQEITQDGLLSDVETFFDSNDTKDIIRPPLVWIEKQEIKLEEVQYTDKAQATIPVNMICGVDVNNDIQEAERECLNLANRCITSLYRNVTHYHPYGDNVHLIEFDVQSIEPNGQFQIRNKTHLLPAARVAMQFTVEFNMFQYLTRDGQIVSFNDDEDRVDQVTYDEIPIDDD